MKNILTLLKPAILTISLAFVAIEARPCSRVVFLGDNGLTMVGRTLDWRTPIPTNLYVYPRGLERQSNVTAPMLQWKSRYASVLAVSYDGGVTEGMNEKGLVMNGLFCKNTIYREAVKGDSTPVISLAVFVSYFLDNFSTVDEIHRWVSSHPFALLGKTFDSGTVSKLHWAATDASGNTLVLEYADGQLFTYLSRDYQVLTNDPTFPEMKAINSYWEQIGGASMLPGTVRSSDRFARASFFIKHVPTHVDDATAVAQLASVMGTVSVPLGYTFETSPNISSTQWCSITDAKNLRYYFKFASQLSTFWIDLRQLGPTKIKSVLKLDTSAHQDMHGCVNHLLQRSQPFTPMW